MTAEGPDAMRDDRDMGLDRIKARKQHRAYGMGLGVILLDDLQPGFPGDVRNASAYPFPIQYEIAEGVGAHALVYADDKRPCREPILRAAQKLASMGCRAIAAECGFFAYFQKDVAECVDVPVFMSSLLQVPLAQHVIGPHRTVGIMVWAKAALTAAHLEAVGVAPHGNYAIYGMKESGHCPELANLLDRRELSYVTVEKELMHMAREFYQACPNMGAMVLECSVVPPWARAVQRALDMPVFSWGTLLEYAYSVVVHRGYEGHV